MRCITFTRGRIYLSEGGVRGLCHLCRGRDTPIPESWGICFGKQQGNTVEAPAGGHSATRSDRSQYGPFQGGCCYEILREGMALFSFLLDTVNSQRVVRATAGPASWGGQAEVGTATIVH